MSKQRERLSVTGLVVLFSLGATASLAAQTTEGHERSGVADSAAAAACAVLRGPRTAELIGIVRDPSGSPIPFATIAFEGSLQRTISDRSGCFVMRAPEKRQWILLVRRIGFMEQERSVDLQGDSAVFADLRLQPLAVTINGVVTTADRDQALEKTGFYDRMLDRRKGLGDGWFITPDDIEQRQALKISSLLSTFPSIKMVTGANGAIIPTASGGSCIMALYLDGARVFFNPMEPMLGTTTNPVKARAIVGLIADDRQLQIGGNGDVNVVGTSGGQTTSIDDLIGTSTVSAIEIYPRAAQAPPQYQSLNGACGVILVWTKR